MVVNEGRGEFEVTLSDYLDTGLFLDHRPVRDMLGEMAKGKKLPKPILLYRRSSVQAALGGAKSTLSIDMSNTYLDWAGRNFELNQLDSSNHQLVRADCLNWLEDMTTTITM